MPHPPPNPPLPLPPHIAALLATQHALSLAQEAALDPAALAALRPELLTSPAAAAAFNAAMADKLIALEPDKCALLHTVARAIDARGVVEAGTSGGISTVYLALAVGANVEAAGGEGRAGRVVGTEWEAEKVKMARRLWAECGEQVERWVELREGDLRETLKEGLPEVVDLLLLDIWTPMALPSLKLVEPQFRVGSVVFADNTTKDGIGGYDEFLTYVRTPGNGYTSLTLPYQGGFEMLLYNGKPGKQ